MRIFLYFGYIFIFSLIKINCILHDCFEYSCEECSSPDYGNCTKCRNSFNLIDGTCPCSFSSCALCVTGYAGLRICEQCKEGYYNYDNNCYCNVNNCEQCAEDGCKKCYTGYYYNETSKQCIKENEEQKIACYDPNCDECFSEEQGACEYCKEGYYLKKGVCFNLTISENRRCPDGYYRSGKYCYERCSGVSCDNWVVPGIVSLCPENECLICQFNELKIISECDNSKECSELDGCLNCITSDECFFCQQGYYLLGGICKKCSEGCSICSSQDNCQYCMSGYELTSNKTCNLTYNFDFNIDVYKQKKNHLIAIYYPEEIAKIEPTENKLINISSSISTQKEINESVNETEISISDSNNDLVNKDNNINNNYNLLSCDENCKKCYDNKMKCIECYENYNLKEDKCFLICSDKNCLNCELKNGKEICNQCPNPYEIQGEKCKLICPIDNCLECSLEENFFKCSKCKNDYYIDGNICKIKCRDSNCNICSEDGTICTECNSVSKLYNGKCAKNTDSCNYLYPNCNFCLDGEGCIECAEDYELNNNHCSKKKDYSLYIIILVCLCLFGIGSLIFCVFSKKRHFSNRTIPYDQQSDIQSNNPQVYNIRNNMDLSGSFRSVLNRDEIAEEFEEQKTKIKAKITCMYCKKKPGNFKCDCGCIVCKEHSNLNEIENNGEKYKACYNCGKKVEKVSPVKYGCNICMQKKFNVVHFKCGCAIEVCKNCYIKCKMASNKCPGCRALI